MFARSAKTLITLVNLCILGDNKTGQQLPSLYLLYFWLLLFCWWSESCFEIKFGKKQVLVSSIREKVIHLDHFNLKCVVNVNWLQSKTKKDLKGFYFCDEQLNIELPITTI